MLTIEYRRIGIYSTFGRRSPTIQTPRIRSLGPSFSPTMATDTAVATKAMWELRADPANTENAQNQTLQVKYLPSRDDAADLLRAYVEKKLGMRGMLLDFYVEDNSDRKKPRSVLLHFGSHAIAREVFEKLLKTEWNTISPIFSKNFKTVQCSWATFADDYYFRDIPYEEEEKQPEAPVPKTKVVIQQPPRSPSPMKTIVLIGWSSLGNNPSVTTFRLRVPGPNEAVQADYLELALEVIVRHKNQHVLTAFLRSLKADDENSKALDDIVPKFRERAVATGLQVEVSNDPASFFVGEVIDQILSFRMDSQ